jgi:glucose-6-phosphate isomerase
MASATAAAPTSDAAVALRQLAARTGRMAELCTEHGVVRMDWVHSVEALVADPRPLRELEVLAAGWRGRGVRHIVWSGMGGSGVTVGVLTELAAGDGGDGPAVHLLDSTDPAAIDALVVRLAEGKDLPLSAPPAEHAHALLRDVVLVAVSMGVTSEEPVTHLSWFLALLAAAGLSPARHAVVMTVPGSRLEEAAVSDGLEARPVFLGDRSGLPGRMSAPGTSVFLAPVALRSADTGDGLRALLQQAWSSHDLAGTLEDPARSPYVRLAGQLADRSPGGRGRLMLDLPSQWAAMHVWIEQLLEQSLGKDGKGVIVLAAQRLNPAAPGYRDDDLLLATSEAPDGVSVPVPNPSLHPHAALAAAMLGWQLVAALLGYRAGTNVVDEPAVEDYKSRARELRAEPDALARAVEEGAVDWTAHGLEGLQPVVDALVTKAGERKLPYIDVTVNGELDQASRSAAARRLRGLGNDVLGVPVKLRRAPAAYHISEQCQLDGPCDVVSLRVVARTPRPAVLGDYTPQFLHAQAVATWQAMTCRGRDCTLVVLDRLEEVTEVLTAVDRLLRSA